jgi:DNA-directed RNA polymerase sigma subunit (sigma70/sigma32)
MVEKGRSLYGEKHKRAKLTEHDVIAIRTIFEKEGKGLSELGRMYGVRHSTIDQIVNRRSWIHI